VSWLRWLVAGLSLRRAGFNSGPFHVGCDVDRVALGKDFLPVLLFSPPSIIPAMPRTHLPLNTRLLSSEGQAGEICKTSNEMRLNRVRKHWTGEYIHAF
jgi:hypothetical protein